MSHDTQDHDRLAEMQRRLRGLEQQVEVLERERAELDRQCRELENEAAQRGIKLGCAKVALARAKIAFDETSKQREEMVQEIAHDLRTPLTSIKGAAQNLLDGVTGPLDGSTAEYVEIIGEHADRLIGVVNWLVQAMRVSAEPLELEEEKRDVGKLVCSVARGLAPLAEQRGIAVRTRCESVCAEVDEAKMRNVVENLVGNALKFTAAGGEVEVTVRDAGEDVCIEVRDTGIGMEPEEVARIFDRYYRSHPDREGSGIGLVISREIVRLHGGDIAVQSEPGRGSRFQVHLPKCRRRAGFSASERAGS